MKKKKPPVLLASVAVVLIGALAIMNRPDSVGGDGHDHGAPAADDSTGVLAESRETAESKESLAAMVKKKVGGNEGDKRMGPELSGDDGPIVVKVKAQKYDPKPGESPTSSGWYRQEYGVGN